MSRSFPANCGEADQIGVTEIDQIGRGKLFCVGKLGKNRTKTGPQRKNTALKGEKSQSLGKSGRLGGRKDPLITATIGMFPKQISGTSEFFVTLQPSSPAPDQKNLSLSPARVVFQKGNRMSLLLSKSLRYGFSNLPLNVANIVTVYLNRCYRTMV